MLILHQGSALTRNSFSPSQSYLRVATACPEVAVGDVAANMRHIGEAYIAAGKQGASLVVFPELSLTGYTLGDLVQQHSLLDAARAALIGLAGQTSGGMVAMVVGLPLVCNNALYNCAAVLANGQVHGIVPKTNLPTYKEFYDKRWFQSWRTAGNISILIGDHAVPFGTDLLFQVGRATLGIEICEDLWVGQQPSIRLVAAGAHLIANPSASPEQLTKDAYRRQLVTLQSARLVAAYLYAGCDASESTTDIVMSGHQIIAENGVVLAERPPLTATGQRLTLADIDFDHLTNDRLRDTNFPNQCTMPVIDCGVTPQQTDLRRQIGAHPFVPIGTAAAEVAQHTLDIQAQALATRLRNTGITKVVLGLSGGLDSTLALIVAVQAANRLGRTPGELIQTITMPGAASSARTQRNAARLAGALGIANETIPIVSLAGEQLRALGHDATTQDITYENVQARLRTSILFNRANQLHGMVLGTGDLSEIALGWCTYNGDHMSHYNVNASIPKTLVRHLVAHAATLTAFGPARSMLRAILATPISPELTTSKAGRMSQQTEAIIGPYELHDFFLYHLVRWGDDPRKIAYLAAHAFGDAYSPADIRRWLRVFLQRFMSNQWKRSVAVDGPKVGSVSLSPRGDWRMPSDIGGALWIQAVQ